MNQPAPPASLTLNAVYDLACSPPTYDFLSFLAAAEHARVQNSLRDINLIFQPGPKDGFRDDNLPPDSDARRSMLWRICVPATRLLPSVKNVFVLSERMPVAGAIFPPNWNVNQPVACYGTWILTQGVPRALRATAYARKTVAARTAPPYVTVTLRQCAYWPQRNSNMPAWEKAIAEIKTMGHAVEIIQDTSDTLSMYAWDIDMRLALYEGAVCNLMVVNGPVDLLRLSNAPYLIFKLITPECPSTTVEFLKKNNVNVGDQFGPNGRTIWEDDTEKVIIREFNDFIASNAKAPSRSALVDG